MRCLRVLGGFLLLACVAGSRTSAQAPATPGLLADKNVDPAGPTQLSAPPPERNIGFVMDEVGSWLVNGHPVVPGQAVPAGGRIRLAKPASRDTARSSITIVLLNNQAVHVSCDAPHACEKDYVLPSSLLGQPSLGQRLTEAALALFRQRPARYVPAIVRGGAESPMEDAVVELSSTGLDMRPCLGELASGSYRMRFGTPDHGTTPDPRAAQFDTLWSHEHPVPTAVAGVQEGLYELTVVSRSIPRTDGGDAWILILSGARYTKAAVDYQVVRTAVQKWDQSVPGSVRRTFLRAFLESLAEQGR
jgi:hypothetical protein